MEAVTEPMKMIVERVAAGLRVIKKPDAFIFIIQEGWTWDQKEILGIPVFHTDYPFDFYDSKLSENCPFIPVWINETEMYKYSNYFVKEYDQFVGVDQGE